MKWWPKWGEVPFPTGATVRQMARLTVKRLGWSGNCREKSGAQTPTEPPAKQKWGRHCCRPHSHRRVDPRRDAWRLACLLSAIARRRRLSGYVARRSRRCRSGFSDWRYRKAISAHLSTRPRPVLSSGASSSPFDTGVSPFPRHRISPPAFPNDCRLRFQRSVWLAASEEAFGCPFLLRDTAIIASILSGLSCVRIGKRSFVVETFRLRCLENARGD